MIVSSSLSKGGFYRATEEEKWSFRKSDVEIRK